MIQLHSSEEALLAAFLEEERKSANVADSDRTYIPFEVSEKHGLGISAERIHVLAKDLVERGFLESAGTPFVKLTALARRRLAALGEDGDRGA